MGRATHPSVGHSPTERLCQAEPIGELNKQGAP